MKILVEVPLKFLLIYVRDLHLTLPFASLLALYPGLFAQHLSLAVHTQGRPSKTDLVQ